MPCAIVSGARSFDTAMSAVSAEPPNARRSILSTSWRAAPSARATRRAAPISTA
jgi:hypothetical protein